MNKKEIKQVKKDIRMIASKLQVSYYEANDYLIVTGKQLLDSGETQYYGQPIKAENKYPMVRPMMYPVNHERQLLKAYLRDGKQGIVEYVKGQNEIHRLDREPIQLHPQWI